MTKALAAFAASRLVVLFLEKVFVLHACTDAKLRIHRCCRYCDTLTGAPFLAPSCFRTLLLEMSVMRGLSFASPPSGCVENTYKGL